MTFCFFSIFYQFFNLLESNLFSANLLVFCVFIYFLHSRKSVDKLTKISFILVLLIFVC